MTRGRRRQIAGALVKHFFYAVAIVSYHLKAFVSASLILFAEAFLQGNFQLWSEIVPKLNNKFKGCKRNSINRQCVPPDKPHGTGYEFRRLVTACATHEQTKAYRQNADANNKDSVLCLRKFKFL